MAINSVSDNLMNAMNGVTSTSSTAAKVAETQDRFLKLLVTQMKNQDPLNPMDNAQVTSQMAQLSTVTGIDKMNTTLESLISNFQASQSVQAAGMIGHNVLTAGNSMALADGKATFGLDLATAADNVQVAIRDASGVTVRKLDLGALSAGSQTLTWDGKDDKGAKAADGTYKFEVTAMSAGKGVDVTSLAVGAVSSVSAGAQGVKLSVKGVGDVNMADVRQIL